MKARFKAKYNIRKGDTVVVIAGDDKDRSRPRQVKEVLLEEGKVIVEGVNMITKHTKPSAKNTQGGIVKKEAPIPDQQCVVVGCKGQSRCAYLQETRGRQDAAHFQKIR